MKARISLRYKVIGISLLSVLMLWSCKEREFETSAGNDESLIRQIHADYVEGWLAMDQEKIMGLLENNARIQPNAMQPIEGKINIENFWFPKDDSRTVINDYKTEILSLKVLDTLAYTTHHSILDWSYLKDTINFSMLQKGINTTIYRKQVDGTWKIYRSMWTDLYAEKK
ncbi:MAG: hypothetical protein HKN54_03125 [Flavobacteriaceae bacterium]|nr:hypothetical protein [Flavobacteriaceae bacterium]